MRSYLSFDHAGCSAVVGNTYSGDREISVGLSGLGLMGALAGGVSWRVMRAGFVLQELHKTHRLEQGVEHYLRSQSASKKNSIWNVLFFDVYFVRLNIKICLFGKKKQSVSLEKTKRRRINPRHRKSKTFHPDSMDRGWYGRLADKHYKPIRKHSGEWRRKQRHHLTRNKCCWLAGNAHIWCKYDMH